MPSTLPHVVVHRDDLRTRTGTGAEETRRRSPLLNNPAPASPFTAQESKDPPPPLRTIEPGASASSFLPQHDTKHRHEHDVERRDEACLARAGRLHARTAGTKLAAECKQRARRSGRRAAARVFFCSALYFSRGCMTPHHTQRAATAAHSAAGTARSAPKLKQPRCPALRLCVTKELPQIIAVMSGRTICRTFLTVHRCAPPVACDRMQKYLLA